MAVHIAAQVSALAGPKSDSGRDSRAWPRAVAAWPLDRDASLVDYNGTYRLNFRLTKG
jgi:hypothetical protein